MKHVFKLNIMAGVLLVVAISAGIISCNKNKDSLTPAEQQKQTLSSLMDKMYAESDGSEDEAIANAFEALSPEELEKFLTLRQERDSVLLVKKAADAKGIITAAQAQEISLQLNTTRELRIEMDKQAVTKYGVHLNKLNDGQAKDVTKTMPASKENAKDVRLLSSCPLFEVNVGGATETGNAGRGYYYWRSADNDESATFCDFEYRFDGHYNKVRGVTWFDRQLIRQYGIISRRIEWYSDGYDTFLLFGNKGVALWIGYPGLVNVQMRWE